MRAYTTFSRSIPRGARLAPRRAVRSQTTLARTAKGNSALITAVAGLTLTGALAAFWAQNAAADGEVDLEQIRKEVLETMDDPAWDDGSWGPVLLRLAWHNAGTYSKSAGNGGSDGANIRFDPEKGYGANAGLVHAMKRLEEIKKRHPEISYADLYTYAGYVAIEGMDGPAIPFRLGRSDSADNSNCTPDGRLPDAAQGSNHLRDIFYRMGFTDQEIVALSGAHALGRCHTDRSDFDGPWTRSPTVFSNDYYVQLLGQEWVKKQWNGPDQYVDKATGQLMMLPTDVALIEDDKFKAWVQKYAEDEELFFKHFSSAFRKLTENGVNFPATFFCC